MIDRYAREIMKSIWSEKTKYDNWLKVELAVCEAWSEIGIIPLEDMKKLQNATYNLIRINEIFDQTKHDMTAFTRSITEQIGEEGRWIHLGITSNDVIDTAQNLQLVESANQLLNELESAITAVKTKAIEHKNTLIMGRTHGIHAEPTTFGLKLALWWDELNRCRTRLIQAKEGIQVCKISGAVGTHATIPPIIEKKVSEKLGLKVAPISNQIIQRDRHAHFVTTIALIGASLEKFGTEIRSLQRTEVREVEEPFSEGQTGSSAMPHKRNPELSERICGIARLLRGFSITAMENVALWHERDISHSSAERIILPDACMGLDYILSIFTYVMAGLRVYPENMMETIESTRGVIFSQRVLLSLIDKGLSRENAYGIVQKNAMRSWDDKLDFRELIRNEEMVKTVLKSDELNELFDYNYYTQYVSETFDECGILNK
ncbi:MAG: adenylosuccinate lyase [SAR202 cluster bacterium]|nr:adenylosuccinate lyase [Chloroflexota bacterium]MQG50420.1 adenylosuccinate lyase [SAR202 cluster bacterium]|tara:strand:+ start:2750 stop:4048 length:1299 start_codon:yes stop_codon:yes gene_type:complete